MTLTELIAALERTDGPDYDLDLAIARWCFENGGIAGVTYAPEFWVDRHGGEFTSSIDAALTLVPEGCGFVIMGCAAKVGREVAKGATPAIAVCIAALKARL